MTEPMPGYSLKLDPSYGWTVVCDDMNKSPCPMCIGEGQILQDGGFGQDNELLPDIAILCPRCLGKGTFRLEQDDDGQENS